MPPTKGASRRSSAPRKPCFPKPSWDGDIRRWGCLRSSTPDGPPVLGATPYSNLFLNTGHGTLGWTQAAGSANIVADGMEGKTPVIVALQGLPWRDMQMMRNSPRQRNILRLGRIQRLAVQADQSHPRRPLRQRHADVERTGKSPTIALFRITWSYKQVCGLDSVT